MKKIGFLKTNILMTVVLLLLCVTIGGCSFAAWRSDATALSVSASGKTGLFYSDYAQPFAYKNNSLTVNFSDGTIMIELTDNTIPLYCHIFGGDGENGGNIGGYPGLPVNGGVATASWKMENTKGLILNNGVVGTDKDRRTGADGDFYRQKFSGVNEFKNGNIYRISGLSDFSQYTLSSTDFKDISVVSKRPDNSITFDFFTKSDDYLGSFVMQAIGVTQPVTCNIYGGHANSLWQPMNGKSVKMQVTTAETDECGVENIISAVFNYGDGRMQTGSGENFFNDFFKRDGKSILRYGGFYTVDLTHMHKYTDQSYIFNNEFSVTEGEISDDEIVGEGMLTVRQVKAAQANTYRNYVCVKREHRYDEKNGLIDDCSPSRMYINFSITGASNEDLGVGATISVTRAATDENGVPSGDADTPLFVYGYKILDDAKTTLGNINNAYLLLEFGEGTDKFYAMDVTITTDSPVSFTFSAAATYHNTHRYKRPNSYYLSIGDYIMTEPLYMGSINGETVTAKTEVLLTAGMSLKLFSTGEGTGDSIHGEKFYGIGNKNVGGDAYTPNIEFVGDNTADNFFLPKTQIGHGAEVVVKVSGKYRIEYSGAVHKYSDDDRINYIVDKLTITKL